MNAVNRFQASDEVSAALAQLDIQLGSGRFAPHLNVAQRRFMDNAKTGGKCTHQTIGKLGLRQPESIANAQILEMAALHQIKIVQIPGHGRLGRRLQ